MEIIRKIKVRDCFDVVTAGGGVAGAAALALDLGQDVDKIDVAKLQKQLEAGNMLIHFDDAWLPGNAGAAEERASAPGHL